MPWPAWHFLTALAFVLCNFCGPSQAFAQGPVAPSPQVGDPRPKQVLYDFEAFLAQTFAPGLRFYAFEQKVKLPFDIHDTDRDGAISDADRQRNSQRFEAVQRAQQIGLMLQADLNSDGVITAEELAIHARYQSHFIRGEGAEFDARRAETMRRIVEGRNARRHERRRQDRLGRDFCLRQEIPNSVADRFRCAVPLSADPRCRWRRQDHVQRIRRCDGAPLRRVRHRWRRRDLSRRIRCFLAATRITGAEGQGRIQPSFDEKLAVECAVPKPAKDIKFVLFNGYRPVALSTAAIGSQDKATMTTKVIIEPGAEPLYLVMIAWDRVIWQFEGSVERVKRRNSSRGRGQ